MKSQNNSASSIRRGAAAGKYRLLYLFIGLFGLISVVFGVYPMMSSIFYSFYKTNTILTTPQFVGFGNYVKLFQDTYFWNSLRVTLLFTVICVPLNLIAALGLAQLLHYRGLSPLARLLFKLAVFIPFITPDVVSAVVWKQFFNSSGAMNSLLKLAGIPPQNWLTSRGLAITVLAFVELWKHVGLYTIILLTNYQLIDQSMYEAARTDGAGGWQMYLKITLPSLHPALMLNLVYAVIQFMKTYTVSRIITFGGPNYATNFLSYYAYSKYEKMDFGMATAIATFLFVLIIGLTMTGTLVRRRLNENK